MTISSTGDLPREDFKLMVDVESSRTTASLTKSLSTPKTSPSPNRSRSSSTLPVTTSLSPAFFSSRSPTHSPTRETDGRVEKWDMEAPSTSPEKSQDPLLLNFDSPHRISPHVSPSRAPLTSIPLNESLQVSVGSPENAPTSPRQTTNPSTPHHGLAMSHSQSPDPLSLFGPSSSPSSIHRKPPSPASRCPMAAEGTADELLMFSPAHPASRLSPLSPLSATRNPSPQALTLPSSPSRDNSPRISSSYSSPPANPTSHRQAEEDTLSAAAIQAITEEDQRASRYSLRQRQPAQLKPYTLDQIQYVHALQNNPDAIIKLRNIPLHRHRHPDDHYEDEEGETQQDYDAEWEAQERRRIRREELRRQAENETPSGGGLHEPRRYDTLLPDLPSTDDEDREMDTVAKEARKILRTKEKQRKAREKEERRRQREEKVHKPKPYPLSKARPSRAATPGSSNLERSSSRIDVLAVQDGHDPLFSSRGATPHFPSPDPSSINARLTEQSSVRSPAPPNEDDVIRDYFNEDDDFYMDDPNDPLMQMPELVEPERLATLPPTSSSPRNLHDDVIEVDSGDDQPRSKHDRRHLSVSSSCSEIAIDLPKSKRRVLGKMMPAFMINKLVQGGGTFSKKKPDKRDRSRSPTPEHTGPLAPGETRVRKIAYPANVKDIKGDSESEGELHAASGSVLSSSSSGGHSSSESSDSDSDGVEILHTYQHRSPRKSGPEITHLVHGVSDTGNSSDDEDIQFFVRSEKPVHRRRPTKRMRDQSLIDWMLPRVRTTGGNGKERKQAKSERRQHRHRSSSYKLDVMARGSRAHGRERQTLLSFDNPEGKKRKHRTEPIVVNWRAGTGGAHPLRHSAGDQEPEDVSHDIAYEADNYVMTVPDPGPKLSRKEREKLRRAQAKKNGVYNFSSGSGRRVTTGRSRDKAFFTVDLEDEGFHRALAPLSVDGSKGYEWPKKYEGPSHKKAKPQSKARSSSIARSSELAVSQGSLHDHSSNSSQAKEKNSVHIAVDLNIRHLPSGRSFAPSSYIRKGRLHELINVVFRHQDPPMPVSSILRGYEIGPTMGVEKLCSLLPKICDSFLEFSGGLPDPDFDDLVVQWSQIASLLPQLVSWYLMTSAENLKALLLDKVEREILRLVDEIKKLSLTFIDIPILTTIWFAVDLASRLIPRPSYLPASNGLIGSLKASSTLLMQFLLQCGIQKTSDAVQSDKGLESTSIGPYTAELWVCLIHLLNGAMQEGPVKVSKNHAFWTILTDVVQARVKDIDASQSLKASEEVWLTVFSVCSLSQISVHGMTTGEPRLPACWDLIALALKTIRLTDSVEQLRDLGPIKLQLRDQYVGLVTSRCSHLREKWHWRLDDGSPMFNQLAEIFRSRNFANLRHEAEGKLPKFFVAKNWDYLSAYSSSDSAFSIFLKLIVHAAQDDQKCTNRKSSAKVKKLLSLAVPLGSLPFSKTNPPSRRDFAMYWNRLSAVAVAIFLDPNGYDDRTKKARYYVAFDNADYTTRHLIINGIVRLAVLLITRNIQITAVVEWIEQIAQTLQSEVKEFISKEQNQTDSSEVSKAHPVRLTSHLFDSVSQIVSSYKRACQYPDVGLLMVLKPLLVLATAKTEALRPSLGYLASEVFTARSLALPKPPRPVRLPPPAAVEEESQESQDFGGIDLDLDGMDWDAPGLAEALGDMPSSTPSPEQAQKENALRSALSTTQFKWVVYSHLRPYLQPPPPNVVRKDHFKACDQWLRLWLCCANVETQPNKWTNCLSPIDNLTTSVGDENWTCRVNLSIMYQLLQLDPMAYLTLMDRATETLLLALTSSSLDLENGYLSILLSIDNLQHPLFANFRLLPPRKAESGDFEFSTEEFVEIRLPLLQAIFQNLDQSLRRQKEGNLELEPENQRYMDFCVKMFSSMRNSRTLLLQKSKGYERLQKYNDFCRQIFAIFQENIQLSNERRFEFWIGWARTLAM